MAAQLKSKEMKSATLTPADRALLLPLSTLTGAQ
jgi:hypothetical protein